MTTVTSHPSRWLGGTLLVLALCVATASAQVHLLPAPREAHFSGEAALPEGIALSVPGKQAEDLFAASDLEDSARQAGLPVAAEGKPAYKVVLLRSGSDEAKRLLAGRQLTFAPAMEAEGYVLVLEPKQAFVVGASGSGVFYGVQTLKQLLPLAGAKAVLPTGTVRDWPAMKYRGIDDDLSRGPFPTLEFQKRQIRVFASFKANIYSPYFEHTLLYPDHPLAAPAGSSLTPAEIAELVRYAARYHIAIVPEQEAFGHLHHVLKYEIYNNVAETPHGHVLAPGQPGTLPLIRDWFTQIAAEFPSPFLHIGADETQDLGQGRTHNQVQQRGYGPVYIDFLKQIHDELAPLHRRLLFWGDMGDANPAAVPALPKDMIAVPWNYWDTAGFNKLIEPFSKNGIETWVAPGDANWNEVYPMEKIAFGNIQGFIRDGQKFGSTGALITVWNDDGEGLFNQNWYGVLFGAVAAWQPGESAFAPYQDAYGPLFHGDATGNVVAAEKELTAAQEILSSAKTGVPSDYLFWLDPWSPVGQKVSAKLLPVAGELRLHAEKAIVLLAEARQANPSLQQQDALLAMDLGARRLDLIGMQFQWAQEMADAYVQAYAERQDKTKADHAHNLLDEISGGNGRCQDLRDAYSATKDEYSQVWLSENRPYWLGNVAVRYDLRIQLWQQRGERFLAAIEGFEDTRELPAPQDLGLPAADASATK